MKELLCTTSSGQQQPNFEIKFKTGKCDKFSVFAMFNAYLIEKGDKLKHD